VGQAGYAYVVSGEGDLLAHPDLSLVLQKRNLKHLRQVQMALDGTPGPFVAQPNLAQLPHSTPCFGFMKAHKGLVFKEEFWKAYIVTNTISFSLDFLMK